MKKLKFKKIDAFTGGASSGNPAGYIDMTGQAPLSQAEMQQIAVELKGFVNEVGFLDRLDGQYRLRFYSSEGEVAFCGHATIAILYDLFSTAPELADVQEVRIHVNAGTLPVVNDIRRMDAVFIMAPAPEFLPCPISPERTARALGLPPADLNPALPLRVINGGLRTLLVPLVGLEACLNTRPDPEALRIFCLDHGIDIVHISAKETYSPLAQYRSRVFAPKYGYLEDPATGSGNAAFGYYLLDEKQWTGDFTMEQGPILTNPNFVKLKAVEAEGRERILFGGRATMRITGQYWLHNPSADSPAA